MKALARIAAGVTVLVALAARPVSAEPDCGVHGACCFPSGSRTARAPTQRPLRLTLARPRVESAARSVPAIKLVIERHVAALEACYTPRFPPSAREVGIQLAILPTGRVELVRAPGFDGEVTHCMAEVIRGATFPQSENGDVALAFVPIRIEAVARAK